MPRPVHFEIHVDDMERAQAFYGAMFGWKFTSWGDASYHLISTGEGPGIDGGMMQRRGPPPQDGQPLSSWVCTVDVGDVDASIAEAANHGGAIAVPKMAIPGVGWLVYVKDSEGNILGMMQQDSAAA